MKQTKPMSELKARRSTLLRQLGRVAPLVEGALAVVHRRCGTPSCRCRQADEFRHRQVMLCRKVAGRSHATHIPKEAEEDVRRWSEEHRRVKALLKEISALSEQMIRGYADMHRVARRQASLRLVGSGDGAAPREGHEE